MFDAWCSSKKGLEELVRGLSNQGAAESQQAKKDILMMFTKVIGRCMGSHDAHACRFHHQRPEFEEADEEGVRATGSS